MSGCVAFSMKPFQLDYLRPPRSDQVREDWAYMLPMFVFLAFTQAGSTFPKWYPICYIVKAFVVAGLLIWLWPHYTKISWKFGWLGLLMGGVGIVQWVGMENWLLAHWPNYWKIASVEPYDPMIKIGSSGLRWTFIIIRLASASLLVPVMEELFWRDFLWRTILAPNDFKLADVGEWSIKAFLAVSLVFSFVHIQWMTAIVWGLMIGGLLALTRSLGACIFMHGMTNFLLGIYVLKTKAWYFW